MNPELNPMDAALEQAVSEIRDDNPDQTVIDAAAARVWARIADAAAEVKAGSIHNCADFQALIPDYRAGRLSEARAMLVKDHINACVPCRRFYEGKVVAFPTARPVVAKVVSMRAWRWAAAAVVVATAGLSTWYAVEHYSGAGRAYVQTVNGSLYEITDTGVVALAAGQDLPDGAEIRTAKDSGATLRLRDGSTLEMRERSSFFTSNSGKDLTVHLGRGSVIVQAAKRSSGHLYVATADFRVAVTGTVFNVNTGVKGSRVSVIEGEVHVAQDGQDKVLRPGQQSVAGVNVEAAPIQYEISWSRNRNLNAPKQSAVTRPSALLDRAPADASVFALIHNASESLNDAQDAIRQLGAQNSQMAGLLAKDGFKAEALLAHLKTAGEYLDDVAIVGVGHVKAPVFMASLKKPGFADFIKRTGVGVAVEERGGFVAFGPDRGEVEAVARTLDGPAGAFAGSPCYARLVEAQREGANAVMCADMKRLGQTEGGPSYFMGEDRKVSGQEESRVTMGFDGARTGIAAWLAPPAPMGSLDYVSPDATALFAFVVKNPAAIVEEIAGMKFSKGGAEKTLDDAQAKTGIDLRTDLGASLGGEFAIAMDGPVFPTPSLKLIAEVYDPARFQASVEKFVQVYNVQKVSGGEKPWRIGKEVVNGRTYYMVGAADPNPLTEVNYTFADGYLIASLGRPVVTQALQIKKARTSISRSAKFTALMPKDHYLNFSAVMYQNLGSTLAPLAGLLGAFAPKQAGGPDAKMIEGLGNLKPSFVAAYGEADRITVAGSGGMLKNGISSMTGGNLAGMAGGVLPLGQFQGTRGRMPAYR
jgi:hypothetical protein